MKWETTISQKMTRETITREAAITREAITQEAIPHRVHSQPRAPKTAIILLTIFLLLGLCAWLCFSEQAFADERAGWELTGRTFPTNFAPGGKGTIAIDVFNVGAAASIGSITVTDTLPPGVTAREAGELKAHGNGVSPVIGHEFWQCSGNGPGGAVAGATVVTCTNKQEKLSEAENDLEHFPGGGGTPYAAIRDPNPQPRVGIAVDVGGEASGLLNHTTIAGGGAPSPASTTTPVTISSQKPPFGLVGADGWFSNADGTLATQAGSHPYEFTLSLDLANVLAKDEELSPAGGEVRDIKVDLPPGVVGDTTAVAQCTQSQLDSEECPVGSLIGVVTAVFARFPEERGFQVFNMVPPAGVPAEFAFSFGGILTFLDSTVRTGGDYGVTTHVNSLSQREVLHSIVTLWGFPGEASHNLWRIGEIGGCTKEQIEQAGNSGQGKDEYCVAPKFPSTKPLFTVPTSCRGPLPFVIHANTWQNTTVTSQAKFELHDANGTPTGYAGCENLGFGPLISAVPQTTQADSPTGLTVDVKPPIGGLQEHGQLGTSDLQNTTVTLPQGIVVNPGQAAGLQACQPSQAALTTDAERAQGQENSSPATCPAASKIATVNIKTPLLEGASEKELQGSVFVLQSNPPDVKLLLAASADGVNLKLVGNAHLDGQTGRLTTTFAGTPELPFTDFKLVFAGGVQATLDTPIQCGTYETTADFTPWSSPFISDFLTNANFAITTGPGGGPCPSSPPAFAPTFTAGSTNAQAGGFSDFTQLIARGDGQQRIEKFQFKEPAGMAGLLSQIELCPEPQAAQGTCPAASHIGHAIVASGAGPNPLTLPQPGGPEIPVYITGPYKGAPFGLSIAAPIVAGPFNLGTIVTRAKIEVDPSSAQITISTDPLPQIVDGVPTNIRSIYAVIDHANFLFNPTNCSAQQFSGTATSVGGATAPLSWPFAAEGCRALAFAPKFTASTSAKTSKANGASLRVKIVYPPGAQANIARVDLTIPGILPTRLTTIQKACPEAIFNANPAGCPPASRIASAIVHTPVLKSPLQGPVYFVSHGSAAFPDVEMLLQGEGITLVVDGKTQIKKGVTFSHFETVPDAPFSSFEFVAPQGPFSIFTANGNLCAAPIKVATTLTAQNGAVLNQSTPLEVQGCANGLQILSHSIKKRTLTLKVLVPSAGKLTVSGKGLSKSSKSANGRSTLTLSVTAKGKGKLKTSVQLSFAPKKGKRLAKALAARFGK